MSVIKMYGRTNVKCLNMPFTNNTLVVANYNGVDIRFLICGKQIAEEVSTDKKARKAIYKSVKENYNIYKEVLMS
jgi:hypothetical protein